jgi:hypothetical protein
MKFLLAQIPPHSLQLNKKSLVTSSTFNLLYYFNQVFSHVSQPKKITHPKCFSLNFLISFDFFLDQILPNVRTLGQNGIVVGLISIRVVD